MTTVNSIQDLIRLLRDQPQWADELRGILLSDELRDLPAAVRDLAQAVRDSAASTGQRLAGVESAVGELTERTQTLETKVDGLQTQVADLDSKVDGLDTKVDALDGKFDGLQTEVTGLGVKVDGLNSKVDGLAATTATLTGQMNDLRGAEYERRSEDRAVHRTLTQMGFVQPRIIKGPRSGMQPLLASVLARARVGAAREQRPLPELTEQDNFLNADIIIADMGDPETRERRSPPVAYALFEASITADGSDVQRAAVRAGALALTTGVTVTPAVIADSAPEPLFREAEAAGVHLFLAPDR